MPRLLAEHDDLLKRLKVLAPQREDAPPRVAVLPPQVDGLLPQTLKLQVPCGASENLHRQARAGDAVKVAVG